MTPIPIPPPLPDEADHRRLEAMFVIDQMRAHPGGWHRKITFWHDGSDYEYGVEALNVNNEEAARRKLYELAVDRDIAGLFLAAVRLDTTRMH